MPRSPRINFPDAVYHVTSRGNGRARIFCYDVLREYGSTLAAARRHYRAHVRGCVMEDDAPILDAIGDDTFIGETERRLEERYAC